MSPTEKLPAMPEPGDAAVERAHQRLMRSFDDVRTFCCSIDGPFGRLLIARTRQGVCRVSFRQNVDEFMSELEEHLLLPVLDPGKCDKERAQLSEYFDGKRKHFRLPVDLRWGSTFQQDVLDAASGIPFGEVASYSDVARLIGRPRAQRAVGNALGTNPIAIVIPCHRVVAADGRIGGYTGGVDVKRCLMDIEGIECKE